MKKESDIEKIVKEKQMFPDVQDETVAAESKFNFVNEDGSTNYDEIKRAFAPKNHQWLLIKDNIIKSNKINKNGRNNES